MIYNTVKLTEEAISQLEAVKKDGIDVMCISGRVFITFNWDTWQKLMVRDPFTVVRVLYKMTDILRTLKLDVTAVFPGNFILTMDKAKVKELDKSPSNYPVYIKKAMDSSIIANIHLPSFDVNFYI